MGQSAGARPIRKPRAAKRGNRRLPPCPRRSTLTACRPRRSEQACAHREASLGPAGAKVSSGRPAGVGYRPSRERWCYARALPLADRRAAPRPERPAGADAPRLGSPRLASAFGRQHHQRSICSLPALEQSTAPGCTLRCTTARREPRALRGYAPPWAAVAQPGGMASYCDDVPTLGNSLCQ